MATEFDSSVPRIKAVRVFEVVVPVRPGAFRPDFANWDQKPICLLEVTDSDGCTGLGEVFRGVVLADIERHAARLCGLPVGALCNLERLPCSEGGSGETVQTFHEGFGEEWLPFVAACEMAGIDLAGRHLGCRAVDLLGGAVRNKVSVDYWSGYQDMDELDRVVHTALESGFNGLKLKTGLSEPLLDQVKLIEKIAGAGFRLTIDAVGRWKTMDASLHLFRGLEHSGLDVRVEDPFPHYQHRDWEAALNVSTVPLVWHARDWDDLCLGFRVNAHSYSCGETLHRFMAMAAAVQAHGAWGWHATSIQLGVAQAACLHAAACAPACALPSDLVSGFVRQHTLTEWDWSYEDGFLSLPESPGLGMTLDRDAVSRFCRRSKCYRDDGSVEDDVH